MNKKKILIVSLSVVILTTLIILGFQDSVFSNNNTFNKSILSGDISIDGNYKSFLENEEQVFPNEMYVVDINNYSYEDGLFEDDIPYIDQFTDDENIDKNGVYVPETGNISFNIDVDKPGLYQLNFTYYNIKGRGSSIIKGLMINDEYQFKEAESISFFRFWKNEFSVAEHRKPGINDIRPPQIEKHLWANQDVMDQVGYHQESFYFKFEDGINKITLISIRESMVIGGIKLYQAEKIPTYSNYLTNYENLGIEKDDTDFNKIVQAEDSYLKSSPSLNPIAEYSTYKFTPYEGQVTRYNAIGGVNFRTPGEQITWEVNITTPGLYLLTFKVMQNFSRGQKVSRRLEINGEVPFKEAYDIGFGYSTDLQNVTLRQNEDYYIYLEAGSNLITLKSTVGIYANAILQINDSISKLRKLYRDVVVRTGLNPDPIQDYLLHRYVPNLDNRLDELIESISEVKEEIIHVSNGRTGLIGVFDRLIYQLNKFTHDEKNIQNGLRELEQNISNLGSWVINISEQPLTIDEVIIHGSKYKLPRVSTNFFEKIWHEITMFFASFSDSGDFGSTVEIDGPTIEVWIGAGRDQTTILRQLIDESFTTQNGINVRLKMVNMSVLLAATLSGNGPDVAIGIDQKLPVNWGIRNAIVDLTTFDDFEDIASRFSSSALEALTFDNKVYGLPDTEDFMVTFYRNDILEEMGINNIPTTWDEIIDISPQLQKQYFDFYIPLSQGSLSPVLYAMMLQQGGELYINNGAESGLLQPANMKSFLQFTRFFTDYGFVLEANFLNRFRSGEMPIGIANFTLYNSLAVFAPDIQGQWDYGFFPGTIDENNNLHQETISNVTASIILAGSKEQAASWEYIKWWLSEDAQIDYARGMEAVLGAAARYPTANLAAFNQLPWPAKELILLNQQRSYARGIPTVPGDYIVGRYIDNAFRQTLNGGVIPQDSLYQYHLRINEELTRKRQELGLE